MKKILVLSNHPDWTYNLRAEVLQGLLQRGHRVIVVVGYGKRVEDLKQLGCEHIDVPYDRHGRNFLKEIRLYNTYKRIIREIHPDVVLSYTVKPNLYGAYLSHRNKIPCIANITGLGTAVEYPGLMQKVLILAYKLCFNDIYKVFFQNTSNRDFFIKHKLVKNNYELLPGSGVNVEKFIPLPYPPQDSIEFVFVSRIMKEKGIDQYLAAAKAIRKKYSNTRFHVCGFCEPEYSGALEQSQANGDVIYHGMVDNVREILNKTHCMVFPTYYPEGMSNVLLENAACARPIITTNRPGCREIVEDGYNGFICKAKDEQNLISVIEKFLSLDYEEKNQMGLNGRKKVEKQFDRKIVVEKYIKAVESINNE